MIAALPRILIVSTTIVSALSSAARAEPVSHVIMIGLDGCRPELIQRHAGPNLRALIEGGTVFWNAQSELPSVTQVNWTSILTGSSAARHGIDRHPIEREVLDEMRPAVPTLFEVAAEVGHTSVGFLGHWKLLPTMRVPVDLATMINSPYEAKNVAPLAAEYFVREKPAVCFVWMGDLDGIGHKAGWMSDAQIEAMAGIDEAIGTLIEAAKASGVWQSTLLVVCSDHGGEGQSHGEGRPADRRVPLIFAGPGVAAGASYARQVSVTDVAPTVLALMGKESPRSWDGQVIKELITSASMYRPYANSATDGNSVCVQAFYYPWYATPEMDGEWKHWQQADRTPPTDIASDYYPLLGPYSSSDPKVIEQHMAWARRAGIDVLIVSWWGHESFEGGLLGPILDAATEYKVGISVHIEPYETRTPESVAADIRELMKQYGEHPALARSPEHGNRPMFYLYQVLDQPAESWRRALDDLRDGGTDVLVFAQTTDLGFIVGGGFDGAYPYDGFAPFKNPGVVEQWYGSLAQRFAQSGKIFVGTVCPGYLDDAAVPNGAAETTQAATRDGGDANTYDSLWRLAIDAEVPFVAVTSFNEWHEGSQIEPAGHPHEGAEVGRYREYIHGPMFYLDRTRHWADLYRRQKRD